MTTEAQRARQRRYRERRIEEIRERQREWAKTWRAANPEKSRERGREFHAKHPEAGRARARRNALANPAQRNENEARRRARLAAAPEVEIIDREAIIRRDKSRCHICLKRVAAKHITLDHLVPLSKGGAHTAVNLAVAHRACNSRRKDGRLPAQLLLIGSL